MRAKKAKKRDFSNWATKTKAYIANHKWIKDKSNH